jgi:hypothetical protein
MTPFVMIFTPFVRLFFHSLAASLGFCGIAAITVLPVRVIKLISDYIGEQQIAVFEWVDNWILHIDAILLLYVIAIYSCFFAFEQIQALRTLFQTHGAKATVQITNQPPTGGGATS